MDNAAEVEELKIKAWLMIRRKPIIHAEKNSFGDGRANDYNADA